MNYSDVAVPIGKKISDVFNFIKDPILIVMKSKVVYLNPTFTSVFGYTIDDLSSRTLGDLFLSNLNQSFILLNDTNFSDLEVIIKLQDNTLIPCRMSGSVVMNNQQICDMEVVLHPIVRNITKVKDANERNKDNTSQEIYKSVFNELPVGIIINEIDGSFNLTNQTFEHMLNYTKEELIEVKTTDISFPEELENQIPLMNELTLGKRDMVQLKKRYKTKDGRIIWVKVTYKILTDKSSGKKYYLSFIEDITRELQQEKINKSIQEQSIHLQKMEAIGRIASEVTHDLGNIFTIIDGGVNILQSKFQEKEEMQTIVDIIEKATDNGSKLIKKLLIFTKKSEYKFELLKLHDIIDETINLSKTTLKKINITTMLQATDDIILGDKDSIQNSLLNLFINAKDAMPLGGKLNIETTNIIASELSTISVPYKNNGKTKLIDIRIRDSGSGISQTIINSIFEPFFTTKGHAGTGLGLASTQATMTQHNGIISVVSQIGEGTEFQIILPIAEE
ncbi:MAG: PAS domain S-box protein [Candidatus Heimdallarchaeota archaeon]|nr:PAS domain S-box protein [Candidatus Heimdallarchaeota archaeon]MDH5644495.1 PAS domain S-box protein [Candidatus Heimdallarchaeota archaeon]